MIAIFAKPFDKRVRTFTQLINYIGNTIYNQELSRVYGIENADKVMVMVNDQFKPLPANSSNIYEFEVNSQSFEKKVNVNLMFCENIEEDKLLMYPNT